MPPVEKPVHQRHLELLRMLQVVGSIFAAIMLVLYVSGLRYENGFVRDRDDYVIGIDFVNMWMMGRAAITQENPGENYRIGTYDRRVKALAGQEYRTHQWSYPPSYLLPSVFVALPSYQISLLLFWVISIAALVHALRKWQRMELSSALASPAALICLVSGQIAMLAASVQMTMFRWMNTRPELAGILLGMLSLKPQLGLLYPVFLVATRRWRVFFFAALTTLCIVALTVALWGVEVWQSYLEYGIPAQTEYVITHMHKTIAALMPTMFVDARVAGLGKESAMMVQGAVSLLAVVAVCAPSVRRMSTEAQMLVVAAANAAVTPYLMAYDHLFLSLTIMLYLRRYEVSRMGGWLMCAVVWLPVIHLILIPLGIPGSALLPSALLVWMLRHHRIAAG